jgi:hypothetical protein
LERKLIDLYVEIRTEAPRARVVVLGYPPLLPRSPNVGGDFDWTESKDCGFELLFIPDRDLRILERKLDMVLEVAAARAGVDYINLDKVFAGHEPCGSAVPRWIEFPRISIASRGLDVGTFHPTRNGQVVMARTVECYLYLVTTPRAPYSESELDSCARRGKIPRGPPTVSSARLKAARFY